MYSLMIVQHKCLMKSKSWFFTNICFTVAVILFIVYHFELVLNKCFVIVLDLELGNKFFHT